MWESRLLWYCDTMLDCVQIDFKTSGQQKTKEKQKNKKQNTQYVIFANRIQRTFGMWFTLDFYRCVSVQMFRPLKLVFKMSLVSLSMPNTMMRSSTVWRTTRPWTDAEIKCLSAPFLMLPCCRAAEPAYTQLVMPMSWPMQIGRWPVLKIWCQKQIWCACSLNKAYVRIQIRGFVIYIIPNWHINH